MPPDHQRRTAEAHRLEQRDLDVLIRFGQMPCRGRLTLIVDEHNGGANRTHLRVCLEERHLGGQASSQRNVVAVLPSDELAARYRQTLVQSRARSPLAVAANRGHPSVPASSVGDYLPPIVGRTIVDDDELDVAKGLRQYSVDRLAEKGLRVIDRHQHADARCRAHRYHRSPNDSSSGRTGGIRLGGPALFRFDERRVPRQARANGTRLPAVPCPRSRLCLNDVEGQRVVVTEENLLAVDQNQHWSCGASRY